MWAFLAKKGLHTLVPTFPDFIFNIGLTIEARKDEEMPGKLSLSLSYCILMTNFFLTCCSYFVFIMFSTEVLLGGCRLMNLDPDRAVVDGVDDVEI